MYEVSFVINYELFIYLLLGFGIGYLVVLGVTSGNQDRRIDSMKHDLAAKKEWLRMLAEQKKERKR